MNSKLLHVSCSKLLYLYIYNKLLRIGIEVDESGPGVTYYVIAAISMIFIVLFFPFSLLYTVKVS